MGQKSRKSIGRMSKLKSTQTFLGWEKPRKSTGILCCFHGKLEALLRRQTPEGKRILLLAAKRELRLMLHVLDLVHSGYK